MAIHPDEGQPEAWRQRDFDAAVNMTCVDEVTQIRSCVFWPQRSELVVFARGRKHFASLSILIRMSIKKGEIADVAFELMDFQPIGRFYDQPKIFKDDTAILMQDTPETDPLQVLSVNLSSAKQYKINQITP